MTANRQPNDVIETLPNAAWVQDLAVSELRYRRLFESAKDGILILDAKTGMVLDVNPFLVNLLGFSREAFLGKEVWELGFFKDIVANYAHFTELQQKEYIRYEDKPLETADGRRVDVEFVSNVYQENHTKVIQCNIRNITARKRAEEAQVMLAMAVERVAETIVITDADAIILYVNPAFEKITGYTREEVIGQNPRILKSGKQDTEFYRRMWAVLSRGEVWRGRFTNRRKDGSLYEENASIAPVRNAAGKIVNYVAAKRDVTYETQLESQLNQSMKMEAVGRLAGGVAHDFNNLLGVILGNIELILMKMDPTQPLYADIVEIRKAAERSATLTSQLLAFARKQAIVPKLLNLNDTVAGTLKLLVRLIGEDVNLTWQPGANLHSVRLDPSQVNQVLTNLCINARDAIDGVGKITLETGNCTVDADFCAKHAEIIPGAYVCLSVSDDGCGMDRETLSHIFEPFFTTKDIGKGTGLGLATVYGIVKQNNGLIHAYSEVGQGTTFKIYFPCAVEESAEATVADEENVPDGRGETILLVEDEDALRTTCQRLLEGLGYNVLTAETPEEALKLLPLHTGDIQLLLTDVVMPGMNGRQLAMQVTAARPGIKVMFMSGYMADVIAQRGVLEQDINFISKPFTRNNLAHKVRAVLEPLATK